MPSESPESKPDRRARGRPRGWTDAVDKTRIKSLDRAMKVLARLSEMGGATLTELSNDQGQAPASIYRVLVTLEDRDLVDFDNTTQTWHIGAGAFLIGSRFLRRTSLVERARPVLRQLMEKTGETANLGVERDGRVLFLSQVETHQSIRAFFPPGTLSPMHSSGIGKALLAQMPAERVASILSEHGLEIFTSNTLGTREDLARDLAQTKRRGFAIDAEEKNSGMRCIAAAIFDVHGDAVAGVSISGPSARLPDDKVSDMGAAVSEAAKVVTRGIGGQMP